MSEKKAAEFGMKKSRSLYLLGAAGVLIYAIGLIMQAWRPQFVSEALPLRVAALAAFTFFAVRRRSLTVWIIWGMLAGVEFGLDAPHVAVQARVFSDIFLRLIQVIVAPLILGTLITGIAGHGEIRSVGRMGLKSLVYFEVLTTVALVLGLLAINLSKAGEGLSSLPMPRQMEGQVR